MHHLFRNYFFQWNCFTVWPKNVQCMKCNAHLPSKQANESLHKAIWHAGFLHSIEKKKCCFVHVCVCVLHCFLGWLVRGCCFFFFVVRGMWRIYFSRLLILTPLFHCCMFEGDALVIHFLNLLPFAFFLSYRTFPFVNWLLSLFAPLLNCALRLLLLRRADGVFAAAFAEVDVTGFCVPGRLKCTSFHLLCCFIGVNFLDSEWYTSYN